MHTSNNAIDGPDGISSMYANKIPINEQLIPHICVPIRVDLNELPIWLAVKTGIINNAETRIIPNSFTPQMRAIDVPIKRKYLLNVTGKLITYANSVWIVVITRWTSYGHDFPFCFFFINIWLTESSDHITTTKNICK